MKSNISLFIGISLIFSVLQVFSQKYPKEYFRSPLDIPLVLSGTFGELRSNHFHSGIDIKTQGTTGLKVYAAAGGYISRIKISPWGYGNALYISHPNGYTTVYAHLDHFNKRLDSLILSEQYRRKKFAIDYYPAAGEFKVKKGEVIAYSGNSGSSGGPHLHFEIRDAAARPLNPFLFGIKVSDNIKPVVKAVMIYNITNQSYHPAVSLYTFTRKHRPLSLKDTIRVMEDFYIGLRSYDLLNGANNHNGIYSYSVMLDSVEHFRFIVRRLDFSKQRQINAYIDYGMYYKRGDRFQRTIILPGNKLPVYDVVKDSGIFHINDSEVHRIDIISEDFAGNKNIISFRVKKGMVPSDKMLYPPPNFNYDEENSYSVDDAKFSIPKNTFYRDIYFTMSSNSNKYTPYSNLIKVGSPDIPMQKYATLRIKADSSLTSELYSKAAIASLSKKNLLVYEGGSYSNGWVECKTRSMGSYFIVVDTLAPVVRALNIYNGKNIAGQGSIDFKVTDDLSGIARYNAYVNGKWVLAKYDPKRNRISIPLDGHFPKGNFDFKFMVSDDKKNTKTLMMRLSR